MLEGKKENKIIGKDGKKYYKLKILDIEQVKANN